MKILTIFIDMIRANRHSLFNDNVKNDTLLDEAFKNLGGTVYTNCFTPGPDTPRGISSFLSGKTPYENGCDTRLKWPQFFLKKDINTVFDLFLENNYEITSFSSPHERATGFFPQHIAEMDIHNSDHNIGEYLSDIKLKDDHFVFVGITDYHWAFNDYGYTTDGEKKSYIETKKVFDTVFKNIDKDEFDHIFIFSDHGFKFAYERKFQPRSLLLNDDRTNIIMLHREKGQNSIVKNNKLCSLTDLYNTYNEILTGEKYPYSLMSKDEREYIIMEEHKNFTPSVNQNIELWAVTDNDNIYIRELGKATNISRKDNSITNNINEHYDNLLCENSSYGKYSDEYSKLFLYKKNILTKSLYSNGEKRLNRNKWIRKFYLHMDYLKYKLEEKKK